MSNAYLIKRPKWKCTSCGKQLPESQRGWGLIWDSSDTGMCAKCLYDIRNSVGYFDVPQEKRRKAPKTRKKRKWSPTGWSVYSEIATLAMRLNKALPHQIRATRCAYSITVYVEKKSARTRLKPSQNGVLVQQRDITKDWGETGTQTSDISKALLELYLPHVASKEVLTQQIERLLTYADSDIEG